MSAPAPGGPALNTRLAAAAAVTAAAAAEAAAAAAAVPQLQQHRQALRGHPFGSGLRIR